MKTDRLRVRDELRGRRIIIEISPSTYKEILDKLIEAGYDWLVWPDFGQISMDGFVIRNVNRNAAVVAAVTANAPTIGS